jgi:MYXO-CTERM domain-containing protein
MMVEEGTTSGFVALNVAYDINNFGQIVGTGDYYDSETGMTHEMGFMLSLSNVPEPSASGALAGLMALGAVALRRRRRG